MWEQNASYLAKHSELGSKNLYKICLIIIEKALKWPLKNVDFQKFSGGACPRTSLEHVTFFNQRQISFAEKNIVLPLKKNVEIKAPFFYNFSLRYCVYVYMHVFIYYVFCNVGLFNE